MNIIRNRTIRPSSRKDTSISYKVNTKNVLANDKLIVNINHETKPFRATYIFKGVDIVDKNSISFSVTEQNDKIKIIWSKVTPIQSLNNISNEKHTKINSEPIATNNEQPKSPKDEDYVLDICDKVLEIKSSRQHKFDFLLGDKGKNGKARKLPVDAYYEELKLVIEYREKQHIEKVNHFDKPNVLTVSGVSRGEQRKLYDERRRIVLPNNGIELVEISYSDFNYNSQKRILRNYEYDEIKIKEILKEFIDNKKNGR